MLKNILKLEGAQNLNKQEQKEINGGMLRPSTGGLCNPGSPIPTADHWCHINPTYHFYINGVCHTCP